MRRDPTISRIWRRVIEPGLAGHFDLPEDVLEQVAMVERQRRHLDELTRLRDEEGNAQRASGSLGTLWTKPHDAGALPGAEVVLDACRTAERLEIEVRVLADRIAANEAIFVDHAEMVTLLKRALDDTLARARELAPVLERLRFSEDAVLAKGSKSEREDWLEAQALVERYASIRSAQRALHEFSEAGWPSLGSADEPWLELANLDQVFPGYLPVPGFGAAPTPPWPTDLLQRLFWLATGPAVPWIPSDAELAETLERVREQRASTLAGVRTN